ncbi:MULTISPECIES: DUF6292 family protein [Amycolatopsis]|uniref:DUF6292 family protein n=1 Tax=Amycolatopsis thermalba TaxID=944492 RepID=A0ABY4P0J5_9PSEU|nr:MULTISPECIES: DUF6292 family protein [Amycolatopsis]OXM63573.1 hypothetical protein CF166_31325 [Amycolatopsis sp. KNN50.9b]UQS25867.1 DUF6292 family protein [Amycolatopsis thermalba]
MFPNPGLDPQSRTARGLRRYIELIEDMLGLSGQGSCVQLEAPLGAYIAIDGHVPAFPERDVALLWDERYGWAVAVEARCGEDLLVLGYLGGQVVPAPRVVAAFVRRALGGECAGSPEPEVLEAPGLHEELAAYAPAPELLAAS